MWGEAADDVPLVVMVLQGQFLFNLLQNGLTDRLYLK